MMPSCARPLSYTRTPRASICRGLGPPTFALITQQWWHVANKGERRHFIRTLVQKTLWRSLSLPQPVFTKPVNMLLPKQALINRRPDLKKAI